MPKIFSITPTRVEIGQNLSPTDLATLSPSSTLTSPIDPPTAKNPLLSSDKHKAETKNTFSHRSKVILSIFLSPAGYRLLRLDHSSRKANSRKQGNIPLNTRKRARLSITQRLQQLLIDPEDYREWFSAKSLQESEATLSFLSGHPSDISASTRAGIRGFALGFAGGAMMDVIVPALMKGKSKGILGKEANYTSSFRLGASAGAFAFLYKLFFRQLTMLLEAGSLPQSRRRDSGIDLTKDEQDLADRHKWIPATVASLLAAPAFALIPQQPRRLTMAMYLLTYSGESAYAALEHKGYMQWMPSWLGSWVLFPFAMGQGVHTFVHHGDCCPEAFRKLILAQSAPYLKAPPGFDPALHGTFPSSSDIFIGMSNSIGAERLAFPVFHSSATSALDILETTSQFAAPASLGPLFSATEHLHHHSTICRMFHSGHASCTSSMLSLALKNTQFAVKLYSTLAVLTFLMRGGNVFQKGVFDYFKRTGVAIAKSSMASWFMMVAAFPLYCFQDHYLPQEFLPSKRHYLNGFIGGFGILFESQKRQTMLTLYFTRFALEGCWRRLVKAGWVRNIKHGETLLLGLSMSLIMAIYESTPALERKTIIQGALKKILVD